MVIARVARILLCLPNLYYAGLLKNKLTEKEVTYSVLQIIFLGEKYVMLITLKIIYRKVSKFGKYLVILRKEKTYGEM